jgi:DNA-binding IclR family transcriptional regulator
VTGTRVQAVERSVDLLFALAESPQTLTELVQRTGLKKATAFRLLATLDRSSLVVKSGAEGRYMLGPGCFRLLQGVTEDFGAITAVGRPALAELWERTAETITIHIRVGIERMCVEELPSPETIRYVATVGAIEPLHVGSAGKILLAFMEPSQLDRTVARLPLQRITGRTITDLERLRRELRLTRKRGWAMSDGERVAGAAALSVPIVDRTGLVAALSILGPANRLTRARRLELLPFLVRAASAIEHSLAALGHALELDGKEAF